MEKIDLSLWPEKPYRWMVDDLEKGLRANANYLVALGLFCYTEAMGREAYKFKNPSLESIDNPIAFNFFLENYMGYENLIKKYGNLIYSQFRHGLAHNYHIKGPRSGVYKFFDKASENQFKERGIDTSTGIVIFTQNQGLNDNVSVANFLVAEPYFENFKFGINKFLTESGKIIKK